MAQSDIDVITWREVLWQREFPQENTVDLFTHLASNAPNFPVIIEARGFRGRVRFFIGTGYKYMGILVGIFKSHGDVRFAEVPLSTRPFVNVACQLKIAKSVLPLRTDAAAPHVRACLSVLSQPKRDEQLVLQLVLGDSFAPQTLPRDLPDPYASFLQAALGRSGIGLLRGEERRQSQVITSKF